MRRFVSLVITVAFFLATPASLVARATENEASAPETGFYSLEVSRIHDAEFDPAKVPRLTYWYQEVDPSVPGASYGVVPAARGEAGVFLRGSVRESGNKDTPPAERYSSRLVWFSSGRNRPEGLAELIPGPAEETILRLYGPKKKKLLAEVSLKRLGANQREAAASLGLDPAKFPETVYLAHRGTTHSLILNPRGVFGGNTIEAMAHALWNGYPGFEIDVHMTKDRILVVSHDEKLNVSTDCRGKISEKTYAEISRCNVNYTGVVPNLKFFHNPVLIPGKIPTLKAVLDQFVGDARVHNIVLDVKPGDLSAQSKAFSELMRDYPPAALEKIIFLMRSTKLIEELRRAARISQPLYAFESDNGWERIESAVENSVVGTYDGGNGLSLSLGLGLGMAGIGNSERAGGITAVFQIFKSLPKTIHRLYLNEFGNGSVDIDALSWSKRNKAGLLRLVEASRNRGEKIVGWTVNSESKIQWLRKNAPGIDYILSDLPFKRIAQIQLGELSSVKAAD